VAAGCREGGPADPDAAVALAASWVCVVEHDDAVRDALTVALEAAGMQVLAFRSAAELLDSRALGEVACLVVEADLPGIDGIRLLQLLAADGRRRPTIVMSARLESRRLRDRLRGVAVHLLEKPFGDEQLLTLIRGLLEGPAEPGAA